METKEQVAEIIIILAAAIILGVTVSFPSLSSALSSIIYFAVIISANITAKKFISYYLEAKVTTRFWSWYQYGFTKRAHFKNPIPMLWLPPLLSFVSKGYFLWLAILEFDIKAKSERVSKRHGLYRFSEITNWHIASIASWGIALNLILAIIGYFAGFEFFAKLNIWYAFWSIIPISGLDGSKILAGSRALWFALLVIIAIFLGYSFIVV